MNEKFTWDENKHQANIKKHGVTFTDAATVFDDNDAVYLNDDSHSFDEERFIVIGFSASANLLMVCHCYKDDDALIRIISARQANTNEIKLYQG